MTELRHAKEREMRDWAIIGFDLLQVSIKIIRKDYDGLEDLTDSINEAAELCFDVSGLRRKAEELLREIEGI